MHTDERRWPSVAGIVEHMSAVDAVTYLPDDILQKVDRATMSVSLKVGYRCSIVTSSSSQPVFQLR